MNKKGLAVSLVIYSVILLIISLLYILLGIVRTRYTIGDDLRKSIIENLNKDEYLHADCVYEEIVSVYECQEATLEDKIITCQETNSGYEMHIFHQECAANGVEKE